MLVGNGIQIEWLVSSNPPQIFQFSIQCFRCGINQRDVMLLTFGDEGKTVNTCKLGCSTRRQTSLLEHHQGSVQLDAFAKLVGELVDKVLIGNV